MPNLAWTTGIRIREHTYPHSKMISFFEMVDIVLYLLLIHKGGEGNHCDFFYDKTNKKLKLKE